MRLSKMIGFSLETSHLQMDDDWGFLPMTQEPPHLVNDRELQEFAQVW